MRLPTDKEFNQRETKKPNKKFKVNVSNSRLNRGHTVAAEQKIRGLKKRLRFFKRLVKGGEKKQVQPNEGLQKATANINKQPTLNSWVLLNDVEKHSPVSEEYKLDYDFTRLKKIEKAAKRYDKKIDKRRKKLRSSLEKGKRVHVLSGRLKKTRQWYFTRVPPIKNLSSTNTRSL